MRGIFNRCTHWVLSIKVSSRTVNGGTDLGRGKDPNMSCVERVQVTLVRLDFETTKL